MNQKVFWLVSRVRRHFAIADREFGRFGPNFGIDMDLTNDERIEICNALTKDGYDIIAWNADGPLRVGRGKA